MFNIFMEIVGRHSYNQLANFQIGNGKVSTVSIYFLYLTSLYLSIPSERTMINGILPLTTHIYKIVLQAAAGYNLLIYNVAIHPATSEEVSLTTLKYSC